jgi:integrase
MADLRAWREQQIAAHGGLRATGGSFQADIETYLGRVAAMPTYAQRAAHLELWAQALGRDRPRRSITDTEIDAVLQTWLETATPGTVRKRRTALQSLFVKLDGKHVPNPVKATTNPKPPKPEARGLDYLTIARLLAAMPARLSAKPGQDRGPALAKVIVTVVAYTGIPPGLLRTVTPTDLQLTAGTVRVKARRKGRGVAARTLPLTVEGLAAFKAFHAVNAYGRFAVGPLNVAFKRAAARIGLEPGTVHLYDLRHSFLTELYRVTRDLATVARFAGHAPGSPITARYAQGADAAVDVAAATAFSQALATARQLALKPAISKTSSPAQSPARRKSSGR